MPARDIYHDCVKRALIKDGWTVTDDPLTLNWGGRDLYADLGAQKLIAAEKVDRKIAVEVKSFVAASNMHSLEIALGQYTLYRSILAEREPDRILYLAIPERIFKSFLEGPWERLLFKYDMARIVAFDPNEEVLTQWKP